MEASLVIQRWTRHCSGLEQTFRFYRQVWQGGDSVPLEEGKSLRGKPRQSIGLKTFSILQGQVGLHRPQWQSCRTRGVDSSKITYRCTPT